MRDQIIAGHRWEFDEQVAECFPDMLNRSIPDLHVMRRTIREVALTRFSGRATIVDLGCSLGGTLASLDGAGKSLYGYDASPAMTRGAQAALPHAVIETADVTRGYPEHPPADVTAIVLTLQFINPEQRQAVLTEAFARAADDGLLIVAEKVAPTPRFATEIDAAYVSRKLENGYTVEQVSTKREALRSAMWPQPVEQVEREITAAGWSSPECIWRSLQFVAWVAEKSSGRSVAA